MPREHCMKNDYMIFEIGTSNVKHNMEASYWWWKQMLDDRCDQIWNRQQDRMDNMQVSDVYNVLRP